MSVDEFSFDEQRDRYIAALKAERDAYLANSMVDRAEEVRAELARLGVDVSADAKTSSPPRGKARTEAETAQTRGDEASE